MVLVTRVDTPALRKNRSLAHEYLQRGREFLQAGDWRAARRSFDIATELAPPLAVAVGAAYAQAASLPSGAAVGPQGVIVTPRPLGGASVDTVPSMTYVAAPAACDAAASRQALRYFTEAIAQAGEGLCLEAHQGRLGAATQLLQHAAPRRWYQLGPGDEHALMDIALCDVLTLLRAETVSHGETMAASAQLFTRPLTGAQASLVGRDVVPWITHRIAQDGSSAAHSAGFAACAALLDSHFWAVPNVLLAVRSCMGGTHLDAQDSGPLLACYRAALDRDADQALDAVGDLARLAHRAAPNAAMLRQVVLLARAFVESAARALNESAATVAVQCVAHIGATRRDEELVELTLYVLSYIARMVPLAARAAVWALVQLYHVHNATLLNHDVNRDGCEAPPVTGVHQVSRQIMRTLLALGELKSLRSTVREALGDCLQGNPISGCAAAVAGAANVPLRLT